MDDLISRQAAIDALHGYFDGMLETDTWSPCDVYGLIEILPSAQRTGHWIKGGEQPYFRKHFDIVVCSTCNKRGEHRWNFCPNCGADMRAEP